MTNTTNVFQLKVFFNDKKKTNKYCVNDNVTFSVNLRNKQKKMF